MPTPSQAAIRATLAAHGLEPDERGEFDLTALAAAVAARGWRWTADAIDRPTRFYRFTASVWRPADPGARLPVAFTTRGNGPTEAAALAHALASALAREGRG